MRIAIIGTGYVGLVTGACFSEMGHHVLCLDIDKEKIQKLKKGQIPIYEPGLEEIVLRGLKNGRLHFTSSYQDALKEIDLCFIAAPTPQNADGSCNLSYVHQMLDAIIENATHPFIIVMKSTVPVGTTRALNEQINDRLEREKRPFRMEVVSNPEFLKEGSAVSDCLKPDRIVLGSNDPKTIQKLRTLYASFTVNHDRILEMDPTSAEMTKYASNAMLATRISFMNELANFCEAIGANINQVRIGIGSDSRIGYQFLYPGIGWGGSCFPKDIQSLISQAAIHECPTPILQAVEAINRKQKKVLFKKIEEYFSDKGGLKGKIIAIWGLSFKPNTDDVREAPATYLIEDLLEKGAIVQAFDPIANANAKSILGNRDNLTYFSDEYSAATGADAIALVTEWKQFRSVNFQKLLPLMKRKALFDGRNQYAPQEMYSLGLDYFCIGVRTKPALKEMSLETV